uniref:Putative serine carboxypeptidase n=1 Tax=Rhipicephalus pulchellus TaxID=72859 RepID=L7M9C8_RHIPC
MISASAWTLLLLAGGIQSVLGPYFPVVSAESEPEAPPSEDQLLQQLLQSGIDPTPLFLTPYIDNCSYYDAREKSKIPYFQRAGITAYSGYITVNKTTDSNIFFLLTEVKDNISAPLLLWTQGGPGLSALFGLFLENGPLNFDLYPNRTPNIHPRINTLQNNMSVLYVDLPVGAGFSFTNDTDNGYPAKLEDIVEHVREFLKQFLEVFSEYKNRDFYLAGESYGARYAVAVAYYWDLFHLNSLQLKLKGIIGGNGFLGPIFDVADSSEFLYYMSMVDSDGRAKFKTQFENMKELAASTNDTHKMYALQMLSDTIFTKDENPTLFQNLTLFSDHASPMFTHRPLRMLYCFGFLNDSKTKAMLHAGFNNTFHINNKYLLKKFATDWIREISTFNEHVLNTSNVLLYTGQLDALFPSVNQRNYYKTLNWTHAKEYRDAERCPWIPYNEYYGFAGYMKTVKEKRTFTEVVLLGMSHYGAAEKPNEAYFLINQFIANLTAAPSVAAAS